jgi:uncharacterized RDD family membrane protein YckC
MGRRVVAFVLDYFVVIALEIPLLILLTSTGIVSQEDGIDLIPYTSFGLVWFAAVLMLFAYLDGSGDGATLGKRAVGLRVADEATGAPIGFKRGLKRRLVWIAGLFPFYLGLLWALGDRRHQGWHDKAAHDLVVEANR